jgi:hypothetical protein
MGIDLVAMLVDETSLNSVLDEQWIDVFQGFENKTYRQRRIPSLPLLQRKFDIDIEAEILDWMDLKTMDSSITLRDAFKILEDGTDGLLLLMQWASPGSWEVWEGRCFIYLSVAIHRELEHVDDFYSESTWLEAIERVSGISAAEFSEQVVLDWMGRREELGETIDESQDPKIIPTFEAHTRAAESFVAMLDALHSDGFGLVVGRDHLESSKWGFGKWNLQSYLFDEA